MGKIENKDPERDVLRETQKERMRRIAEREAIEYTEQIGGNYTETVQQFLERRRYLPGQLVENPVQQPIQLPVENPVQPPVQPPVLIQDDTHENTLTCSVCLSGIIQTIIIPCNHCCLCVECSKEYKQKYTLCPICRKNITKIEKIYICEK